MGRTTVEQLITEILASNSGTTFLAREIGHKLSETYGRQASPKSVSKRLLLLEEDYPMINRRPTTNREKAHYNCRYIYTWGTFTIKSGY